MSTLSRAVARLFRRQTKPSCFPIPVLCYHSWTVNGPAYHENDHVALESDLKTLALRGYEIIPLPALIRLLRGGDFDEAAQGKKLVGITFDDGMVYDYCDAETHSCGEIKSFHTLMRESESVIAQMAPGPRALSFVIASNQCRQVLGGPEDQFNDQWWEACATEGIIGIGNHSWDHVHEMLDTVRQQDNLKGSFFEIKTFEDAEAQIAEANAYILEKTGGRSLSIFGYPFGHASPYLCEEYFPQHAQRIGLSAAFSTAGAPVTQDCSLWSIPRFVCGEHWKTPTEFLGLLDTLEQQSQQT